MSTNPFVPYQVNERKPQLHFQALLIGHLQRWPWFIGSLTLFMLAAHIYLKYQPPVYVTKATVLVKDEKKGISEQPLMKEMSVFTESKVVENELEILRSYTLMSKIVTNLGLTVRYYQETPYYKKEIYRESPIRLLIERDTPQLYFDLLKIEFVDAQTIRLNGTPYPVNKRIKTPFGLLRVRTRKPLHGKLKPVFVSAQLPNKVVEGYLSNLKIDPTAKLSTMLVLSLNDPVPDKAEAILNLLVSEYNKRAMNDRKYEAKSTLQFIDDRLALISSELSGIENKVESYKANQGVSNLSVKSELFLTTVKDNDAQLTDIDSRLNALDDVERHVKTHSERQVIAPALLGLDDPVLTNLLEKVADLELKREEMAKTVSSEHPVYQSIDNQIANIKTSVQDNVQTLRRQLTSSRRQLLGSNNRVEKAMKTLPRKERKLLDITRQQEIKNGLYVYLLQKREETALSAASAVSKSQAVDWAHTSSQPVRPLRMLVFAFAGLLGLLIPLGIITARVVANKHVLFRSDVESITQVPIVGEIVKGHRLNENRLIFSPNVQSVFAEQIRALRTNLQFIVNTPLTNRVFLFTSSISGEGKSFVSLNLGASCALTNRRTVIVDLDMRKPKLHLSLFMSNDLGVSDYLQGRMDLEPLLKPIIGYADYYVITAGTIPSTPSELLNSDRLADLFKALRSRFDYILIDSPPIGLVADAQLLAPFVDATVFIIRHDRTPKNGVKMIDTFNKEQRFPKPCIVLNGIGRAEAYKYSYNYVEYKELTKQIN